MSPCCSHGVNHDVNSFAKISTSSLLRKSRVDVNSLESGKFW